MPTPSPSFFCCLGSGRNCSKVEGEGSCSDVNQQVEMDMLGDIQLEALEL